MNTLGSWGTQVWEWVAWGNAQLRHVVYYATMVTFLGVVWQLLLVWRQTRPVRIFVVNADSPARERAPVGRLPRRYVTRAEITGLVAQAAGGETLDFRRFRFDYKVRSTIDVPLPEASYRMVLGSPSEAPAGPTPEASAKDELSTTATSKPAA